MGMDPKRAQAAVMDRRSKNARPSGTDGTDSTSFPGDSAATAATVAAMSTALHTRPGTIEVPTRTRSR